MMMGYELMVAIACCWCQAAEMGDGEWWKWAGGCQATRARMTASAGVAQPKGGDGSAIALFGQLRQRRKGRRARASQMAQSVGDENVMLMAG